MKDLFTKQWIIDNSIEICRRYEMGILTLRALHYQLVGLGMTNDIQHYKRVVGAMGDARWDGLIPFEQFSDLDREMVGETDYKETILHEEIQKAKESIQAWMNYYAKNRWENQDNYVEVLIEKKALQGVFQHTCFRNRVGLGACKGYPSLTFIRDMSKRFFQAAAVGKRPVIIYFGDYDPTGDDIPRSIVENLNRFGINRVVLDRVALNEEQVLKWNLPPAPTKMTDSRSAKWDGLGQVELDAVEPKKLQEMCDTAIRKYFLDELHEDLKRQEEDERAEYKAALREYVASL